ncbi:uncharacterized protein TRIADDRAFT_27059 [Trichoplax adhaerens]|uniref:ubiquitinyl hydrolase 1 n=1 Tax=Trichoplax adhaerens TaxID=10228 RepID=B3S0I6_TRIAD|nr:hypothetical protein TRIADDRAFT_27059 [Trichoplax adhaerens]EDV23649.1 hypothetical protein TRIADDRAFT_27059 [Trichoplax adhaerens]|eukprot:XP_002113175.1 hypothetical protein TRIADDRAFT_27059 [Trichoplax adhaerens]
MDASTEAENLDQKIMDQMELIRKEIEESVPLLSHKEDIASLAKEYPPDDAIYQGKIRSLYSSYRWIRRTRRDGNCFYRAFGISLMEMLKQNPDEYHRVYKVIEESKDRLIELGYQAFIIEDFHQTVLTLLKNVRKDDCTNDELVEWFNDRDLSNYFVVYFRLLTSAHLKTNAEFFENFIDGYQSVKDFCSYEVEPIGKESDHIHAIALTGFLNTAIEIVYLNHTDDDLSKHRFPEHSAPQFTLLYRPGHYDVLYK